MSSFSIESNENLRNPTAYPTKDKDGNSLTIAESGNSGQRLMAEFGKDGNRYCRMISERLKVCAGDSNIEIAGKEPLVTVKNGSPTVEGIGLTETAVNPIRFVMVKEEGDDSYRNLLDELDTPKELKTFMKDHGIQLARVEEGVLSTSSDYSFLVTDKSSRVTVNIGDHKYIESEGFSSLQVSKGTVFIETTHNGKAVNVVFDINDKK